MRTTVTLDDRLAARARKAAQKQGKSFSEFVSDSLTVALARRGQARASSHFTLVTFRGDGPAPGVDLDRLGELAAAEDEGRYGK